MYEKAGYGFALIIMGYLSVKDIREKQIPVMALLLSGTAAVFYLLAGGRTDIHKLLQDLLPGMALLLLSLVTRESIGYGDGAAVLLMGLWCGGCFTVRTVLMAFFLTGFYAGFLLFQKSRQTIPFLPFLLVSMEVIFLYE